MLEIGPAARLIDVEPTASKIYEQFYDSGWTDGLPIIRPTPDLVDRMLKYPDRARHEVVCELEPRGGVATVEKIAINSIKAGLANHVLRLLHLLDAIYDEFGMSGR